MRLFIHETSRYANLVKLFRHLMNGKLARNDLSAEIAKIFNKDANGLLKFYACREVDNERMYYDFETYECISHPGTPRANDRMFETFHTYVITFGDNPTHNIYTHDVKTYPNVHLLLQKIKNEAPRLFGMPDE
jgi:hypothetical protein